MEVFSPVRLNPAAKPSARPIPILSVLALAVGLLALAACGSSSSSKTSPATTPATTAGSAPATTPAPATQAAQRLSLEANSEGQLKYNTASLTAKAGSVSIDFTNMAPLSHNLTVASASGTVVGATPTFTGGSKTLSLTLKPGNYKFYCTVPGHRAAGMEGALTVQ
jgi:plastocyanin